MQAKIFSAAMNNFFLWQRKGSYLSQQRVHRRKQIYSKAIAKNTSKCLQRSKEEHCPVEVHSSEQLSVAFFLSHSYHCIKFIGARWKMKQKSRLAVRWRLVDLVKKLQFYVLMASTRLKDLSFYNRS